MPRSQITSALSQDFPLGVAPQAPKTKLSFKKGPSLPLRVVKVTSKMQLLKPLTKHIAGLPPDVRCGLVNQMQTRLETAGRLRGVKCPYLLHGSVHQ